MNDLQRSLLLLAASVIAGAAHASGTPPALAKAAPAAASPAGPAVAAPREDGVSAPLQQQIDALLKHRLRPEPLALDLPNPFATTGSGVREKPVSSIEIVSAVDTAADRPAIPASNAEVLAACAAKLKIGGVIRMKDQIQVVINDAARKEGDVIAMNWNNSPVQLRIVRLMPDRFLLRFLDAEMVLKY